MAAWIVITSDDLNDYLVGAQASALRSAALATGQTDPFVRVMQDRANYIRNRIAKRIQISATPYAVPPELKTTACMLIIESLQGRLPSLRLSDDQDKMIRRAYKDLDIAATKDLRISEPDDPVDPDIQQGGGASLVNKPNPQATRDTLKGF